MITAFNFLQWRNRYDSLCTHDPICEPYFNISESVIDIVITGYGVFPYVS